MPFIYLTDELAEKLFWEVEDEIENEVEREIIEDFDDSSEEVDEKEEVDERYLNDIQVSGSLADIKQLVLHFYGGR